MTDNRTTEPTATDRLRAMLDERGVEYTVGDSVKGYLFIVNVKPKKRVFIETWENGGMAIWSGSLTPEQAIEVTLVDDEYEEKMDSLLCYLTNGKFSKSRQYSLDFMKSCVDEEYEMLYAKELADAATGGECELAEVGSYSGERETIYVLECSACGKTCEHVNGSYPMCPHCGRKAVKR